MQWNFRRFGHRLARVDHAVIENQVLNREDYRADYWQQKDHPSPAPPVGFTTQTEMDGNRFGQSRIAAKSNPPAHDQNDYGQRINQNDHRYHLEFNVLFQPCAINCRSTYGRMPPC